MNAPEDVRARLAEFEADIERGTAINRELRTVNASLGQVAEHIASATVAALSVMPLTSGSATALGFVGDVLEALGAAMRELTALQAAALQIVDENIAAARAVDERMHSMRADLEGV